MEITKIDSSDVFQVEAAARLLHDGDTWQWNAANNMEVECGYVAMVDSKIVGYADSTPSGKLAQVHVHPDYRRRGIGSALMQAIGDGKTLRLSMSEVEDGYDQTLGDVLSFLRASGWEVELEEMQFVRGPRKQGQFVLNVPLRVKTRISEISGV